MSRFAILCGLGILALSATFARAESQEPTAFRVYVGTYTGGGSEGIYAFELNVKDGSVSEARLVGKVTTPSVLAIHPSRKFLYCVSEISTFDGKKEGGVTAFAIDNESGNLTKLNEQSSKGAGPCHVVVNGDGSHVFVANYGGGNVAALSIAEDGKLGEATGFAQHKASDADSERQVARAHSINLDKAGRFAVAADAGVDEVFVYRFDPQAGTLAPNDPRSTKVAAGAAPRHFAFHPNGVNAYVINEAEMSVTAFKYDAKSGVLKAIQTISTIPGETQKGFSTAEVQVHPSGKFLYGSNRGHDTIAIFRIDAETGKLTAAGHQPTGGKTPRNFGIDPTGTFLLAANQNSGTITVHRIDPKTGALEATGTTIEVARPVCVKFLPLGK